MFVPGGFVIGALQVHKKKGGYYELVVLVVRPVGFEFLFGSPDLRSEILPCFTRDVYKLGRGPRWLGLMTGACAHGASGRTAVILMTGKLGST